MKMATILLSWGIPGLAASEQKAIILSLFCNHPLSQTRRPGVPPPQKIKSDVDWSQNALPRVHPHPLLLSSITQRNGDAGGTLHRRFHGQASGRGEPRVEAVGSDRRNQATGLID